MLQEIYKQMASFYESIEQEYSFLFDDDLEWDLFHFKFLIYYLSRYDIKNSHSFICYHYRVAYRFYIEKLILSQASIYSCYHF